MGLGEWIGAALAFLGPPGVLAAMFLIFLVDAAIFPALPELFILLFYDQLVASWGWPSVATAAVLLTLALAGDVAGNAAVYAFVRRTRAGRRTPRLLRRWGAWVERVMKRWISFLLVRDERVILMNRIAPAVPITGAFIAVCGWNLRRSLAYVAIGGAVKYVFLLLLFVGLGYALDPGTARGVSIAAVLALVAASLAAGWLRRRRMVSPG